MIPVFFLPYEDEFYYGWLYRLANANGFKNVNEFLECFEYNYGSALLSNKQFAFEPELSLICLIYDDNFHELDELAFMNKNTLICYDSLMQYAREFSVKACNVFYGIKIEREKYSHLDVFHFCPICAKEDYDSGHSVYLRTWHQHPSCLVCAKHNVALIETTIPDLGSALCNGQFRYPKDFSDKIYEQRISEWFYQLYQKPVGIDLFLLRYILADELMSINNGRNGSINGIAEAFEMYGTTLENRPYTERAKCTLNALTKSEVLYVSCFLFSFDSFFSKAEYYQRNFIDFQFQEKSKGKLNIIESQGPLYKVRCPKCGRSVVMYNQPFANDFKCPFCYTLTNSGVLVNLLKYTGSGQYRILRKSNMASQMKYKCKICGDINKKGFTVSKLSPLSSLCSCGKSIKGIVYFNTMNSAEIYESIEKSMGREIPSNRKKEITVLAKKHRKNLELEKEPFFNVSVSHGLIDEKQSFQSQQIDGSGLTMAEQTMKQRLELSEDVYVEPQYIPYDQEEYTVYNNDYQQILLHHLCKTYSIIGREDKGRVICKLCYPLREFEQLRDMLIRYSGEQFSKIKQCRNKKSIEMTLMDGRELVLDSEQIIQELTDSSRDSIIFPNKREFVWTQSIYSKVYCAIRDYCQEHDGTWEKENQIELNVLPDFLNKILKYLLKHNYLKMKDGKYSITDTNDIEKFNTLFPKKIYI